jgi:hypothetical protein
MGQTEKVTGVLREPPVTQELQVTQAAPPPRYVKHFRGELQGMEVMRVQAELLGVMEIQESLRAIF